MMAKHKKIPTFKEQFIALKNLPKFFKLIWATNKYMAFSNVVLRVIKASIPMLMLYVGKLIIDEVIRLIPLGAEEDMSYLWMILGIELGLALLSDLISRALALLDSLLGDLFSNATSVKLIEHAAKLDLYQFEDSEFYDKLERARRQTISRIVLMSQVLSQFQDGITLLFLAGGLIAFNPWLLVILIVAVFPSFLSENHFNSRTYSLSRNWTPERRELDYLRYVGASDEMAKEVKSFNLSGFLSNRFKILSDKYYNANKGLSIKRAIWGSAIAAIGTMAYYGAYIFIIIQTVAAVLSVGDMTFLAGSFKRMSDLMQSMMSRFSKVAEGALYLKDLFDFFEIKPTIASKENPKQIDHKLTQGVVFENVSFKYPNTEAWAVRNLSFTLKASEKLALVGENGAGKTTVVKLLARLYEPTEGRILLDGVDIREYDLNDLRDTIGIIFQDFVRFHMKAFENIAIGDIDDIEERERIMESASKSLANTVINRLPNKFDQMLGKRFQNGVELSGGEWQKVALARAYMRDAQILILDEPTAALDARAEHEVFVRFSELIKGKSAVLISHRFSTVRMADRILFLEQGRLLELGSHEELVEQNGKYAELFLLQAQGYL